MTTTHRIITIAAVLLSVAAAGAPTAAGRPAYDPPAAGNQTPASAYSRPDKTTMPVTQAASAAISALTPQQRQRVAALSALSDGQVAAGFGVAPPVADKTSASQALVRVQAPQSGFHWGDAGIGAAGGLALAMLGIGGGLVISRQRPRRARPTTTLPN
jgi:hypothetical protein